MEGAGTGGTEEDGEERGSALEGTGGWDMEIEVMVPVKPPALFPGGMEAGVG